MATKAAHYTPFAKQNNVAYSFPDTFASDLLELYTRNFITTKRPFVGLFLCLGYNKNEQEKCKHIKSV